MKKILTLIISIVSIVHVEAQYKKAYEIFTAEGKKSNFTKLTKKLEKANVLFFGEIHNDPIAHWLELELVKDLSSQRKLIIGTEMFEADQQKELNLYLEDSINEKQLAENITLWSNFNTDYKPLIDFAKGKKYL